MVAPVRCATPGTEVDCAIQPCSSARATIQSANTPPPWPPMAKMAIVSGLSVASWVLMLTVAFTVLSSVRKSDARIGAAGLQPADDRSADSRHEPVPTCGIEDNVGPVERGAENRSLRHLAAIATADTAVVDRSHWIVLER